MSVESYKHLFAKKVLAKWLREWLAGGEMGDSGRGGPNYGVWVEYPVCLTKENEILGVNPVWDESNLPGKVYAEGEPRVSPFLERPPSYEQVISAGLLPIVIFDVAVQSRGMLSYGFEVVHRNDISATKLDYLKRIGVETFVIDADWILCQVKRPEKLKCERII
jgi:hypothetical protein